MIEQISGTGQSGIAEATATGGKQGQNSLFAKLMAMFEKQGKAGDKTSLVNGAKTPTMTLLKQTAESTLKDGQENKSAQKGVLTTTTGLAQQSTADTSKGVQKVTAIIASPAKKLATETENVDGSTVQAVALHALNQSSAEARTGQPAIRTTMEGKQPVVAKDMQTDKETVQLTGKQQQPVNGKTQEHHLDTATVKADSRSHAEESQVDLKAAAVNTNPASGKFDAVSSAASTGRKQGIEQTAANTATSIRDGSNGQPVAAMPAAGKQERPLTADERYAIQQQTTSKQNTNTTSIDKSTPLTAHNHTLQQHNTSAVSQSGNAPVQQAAVLETAMQNDSSGQQSGEKGGQDGRNIQMMASDNRPTTSTTSANTANFQHYMNHKSVPTMTMYESIQHIAHAAKNGQTRLEIQLDPAHLGKIHISLQTDASKQLQVHLIVDQSATRAAIDQQLPALKQALAQQGLDLSGFSMGSHGEQASSGFGNNQSSGGFRQSAGNAGIDLPSSTPSNRPLASSHSGSGLSIHV